MFVPFSITISVGYSNQLDISPAKGTAHIAVKANADSLIIPAVTALYDRIVNDEYPARRFNVTCNRVYDDTSTTLLSLLTDEADTEKNKIIQEAMLKIKTKYEKNAILKGMSFQEAATTRDRNNQFGCHKSGE